MNATSLVEELATCTRRCKEMDAPLADRLAELAADVHRIAPDFADIVDRMVHRLQSGGAGSTAPAIGTQLAPFVLPDENGHLRSLPEFMGTGNAVIAFHRGHWCPYCQIEARALARIEPEVHANGGRIVIITPETQAYTRRMKTESGGQFPILSDLDSGYALELNLAIKINDEKRNAMTSAGWDISAFQNNDDWILPIPATFVLDRAGVVRGRFVDPDYRRRMDVEDMLDTLRRAQVPFTPAA